MLKALKIVVTGLVQGVGFRPAIHRIATESKVKGYVKNLGGSEVEIFVEGKDRELKSFLYLLKNKLPPVAFIYKTDVSAAKPVGYSEFKILPSTKKSVKKSLVPPDFSVCEDCIKEVDNPKSRWFRYPFNSCAFCGPRYSILLAIPYDREKTSMKDFPLCEFCGKEYEDPNNIRRFHAQGISCPRCGPKLWLVDKNGKRIDCEDPLKEAGKLINEGYILSIKGLGGFHIAASATEDEVVLRLRERKKRPQKPFALMVKDIDTLNKLVYLNKKALELLLSPQHPIVLLKKKRNALVSDYVAPGLTHLGVFLPYTPLHHMLLNEIKDGFVIMTSGNLRGEPMCVSNDEALRKLKKIVDYHLLHNRRIINRIDDSVVRFTNDKVTVLRRARGYVPCWISLGSKLDKNVIAFGAMLQNAGGIGFEDKAVLTQYIGDCDEFHTLLDLEKYLRRIIKLYRVRIENVVIAIDAHPSYPTRRIAEKWSEKYKKELVEIQHHWAHVASVMAEYKLEKVVGIAIDGAGYGLDGNIWGGEILLASRSDFKRLGHIDYFPMPGGDLATLYPVRLLIGILSKFMETCKILSLIKKFQLMKKAGRSVNEIDIIFAQMNKSPLTSSLGRVLDAAAVLLDIAHIRTYEGELAMKLEAYARKGKMVLEVPIIKKNGILRIDIASVFEQLVNLIAQGFDKKVLAYNVQRSVGLALAEVALKYASEVIVVSGGAAVNSIILKAINEKCREQNVRVLVNHQVPAGDGGIALGQIWIAGKS